MKMKIGDRITKTMGIPMNGVVINRICKSDYTDGSYREPETKELGNIIYVKWDDGTKGWIHKQFLKRNINE